MSVIPVVGKTPHYFLEEGKGRLGPPVNHLSSGTQCSALYGFSDKDMYDRFNANTHLQARPYPLVKVYLTNQLQTAGDCLQLLIVDATSPRDSLLRAATLPAVLEAYENHRTEVALAYQLTFNEQTNNYQVEEESL